MTIPGVKGESSARFRYKPFHGKIRYFEIGANYSKALEKRGLVSEETVVLRRWGSDTRKFGLSTELIM